MAYVSQDKKKIIAAALKVALKDYPQIKYSLSVGNGKYDIIFTCKQGPAFLNPENKKHIDVNTHWIDSNYEGEARKVLNLIKDAMNTGNHNNSDSQSDYFDVGHYITIQLGKWDVPFVGV